MSTNQYLMEALTRHQIFIQRFSGGVINELLPILERMRDDIRNRLMRDNTPFQQQRLQIILSDVDAIVREAGEGYSLELQRKLEDFAEYESEFTTRAMQEATAGIDFTLPPPEQIAAAVTQSEMNLVQGDTVRRLTVPQLVNQFTTAKREEVKQVVRAGYIEGKPLMDIVRDITDNTDRRIRRQAGAMVRTAVNHMGTQARTDTFKANADVLDGERWTATLDGRTTILCMSRDGTVYPVGEGPRPPAHFACRSVRAPVVKQEFSLSRVAGERASVDGPVSAKLTYSGFLRKQSKAFQDEALGPERARLFREGKVTIDRFVDDDGVLLNLDELRRREGLTLQNE